VEPRDFIVQPPVTPVLCARGVERGLRISLGGVHLRLSGCLLGSGPMIGAPAPFLTTVPQRAEPCLHSPRMAHTRAHATPLPRLAPPPPRTFVRLCMTVYITSTPAALHACAGVQHTPLQDTHQQGQHRPASGAVCVAWHTAQRASGMCTCGGAPPQSVTLLGS
jgi:hypothetical protein